MVRVSKRVQAGDVLADPHAVSATCILQIQTHTMRMSKQALALALICVLAAHGAVEASRMGSARKLSQISGGIGEHVSSAILDLPILLAHSYPTCRMQSHT